MCEGFFWLKKERINEDTIQIHQIMHIGGEESGYLVTHFSTQLFLMLKCLNFIIVSIITTAFFLQLLKCNSRNIAHNTEHECVANMHEGIVIGAI